MKKNRITYLFLLILSFIFMYNFGGFVPSLFFNTLLSALIVSVVYTIYVYYRFKFIQTLDKKNIVKGEKVRLTVKLSNQDILVYPYIYVTFFGTNSVFTEHNFSQGLIIEPFSKQEFVFDLDCKYRGIYEIGINSIYIEDFFGLLRLRYKIDDTLKITVYPRIEQLQNLEVINTNNFDNQSNTPSILDDVVNIKDVRDYSYGDSMKRIHWKLTARNNRLMVKNYHNTSDVNVTVLIDYRKNNSYSNDINLSVEDKIIESAVSVIYYYTAKNLPVSYISFHSELNTVKVTNRHEFDTLYKEFSTVQFNQMISMADILKVQLESSMDSFDLILFTSILDVDLYNEIYNARMSNNTVCLFYIVPKNFNSQSGICREILENLPEIGVTAYEIDPEERIIFALGGELDAKAAQNR